MTSSEKEHCTRCDVRTGVEVTVSLLAGVYNNFGPQYQNLKTIVNLLPTMFIIF